MELCQVLLGPGSWRAWVRRCTIPMTPSLRSKVRAAVFEDYRTLHNNVGYMSPNSSEERSWRGVMRGATSLNRYMERFTKRWSIAWEGMKRILSVPAPG